LFISAEISNPSKLSSNIPLKMTFSKRTDFVKKLWMFIYEIAFD
jgi:hypothetical protein